MPILEDISHLTPASMNVTCNRTYGHYPELKLIIVVSLLMGFSGFHCSKEAPLPQKTLDFELVYPPHQGEDLIPGFQFKWSKSEAAVNYTIRIKRTEGNFQIPDDHFITNITGETYAVPKLKFAASYLWKVIAYDENGTSYSTSDYLFTTKINRFEWTDEFPYPQLDAVKRIDIYLPPDYDSSTKRYPVLYLHDGRNALGGEPGVSGGLGVEYTLNEMYQEKDFSMIAVAIRPTSRADEYSPWINEGTYYEEDKGRGGLGDKYLDFIIENLKPAVDKEFRTLPDSENTVICGTSLGGLISFYAMIKYPNFFGKAISFSPSFWYTDGKIFPYTEERISNLKNNKIYLWAGSQEVWDDLDLVGDVGKMTELLSNGGFQNFKYFEEGGGRHSLLYWGRAFPKAIEWLFEE